MLGPELCLYMRIVQLTDEGICPGLASMHGDVVVILTVPLSPLCVTAKCCNDHQIFYFAMMCWQSIHEIIN